MGVSALVNCEIPLNRYSFFEALEDKLLPNTKIEINFEMESDANLVFQAGADCRVIVKRLQLYIPKLTFNAEGQKLYMENYLKPYKWTYLNEVIHTSNNLQQQTGHYRITTAISTQHELTHKQPIHLYMILLVIYQPMPTYHDVISKLEMVMNILIFTINHLQI